MYSDCLGLRSPNSVREDFGETDNGIEWGAEFMGHAGEEFGFGMIGGSATLTASSSWLVLSWTLDSSWN